MKTTKEIMEPFMSPNTKVKLNILQHKNDKWFSESDIEQLQKELKIIIDKRLDGRKNYNCPYNTAQFLNSAIDIIYSDFDEVFNNFKGK